MVTLLALLLGAGLCWPGVLPRPRLAVPRVRRRPAPDDEQLVALVEALATAVGAGVMPATAVAVAGRQTLERLGDAHLRAALAQVVTAAEHGGDLTRMWWRLAAVGRQPVIVGVARTWALSEATGCPLARSLRLAARLGRFEIDQRRRLRIVTAAPRASMQLLTGLPVLGVLLATALGADPLTVYAGPLALVTLLPGVALVLAGRRATGWMIRRATAVPSL
ncbi:hypothetical protein G9U51_06335 [Calidifontibacter sp. DB0510]|uniref:Type II secretion system protein GspF domain-containing protein n=1 Tax=Metallococcus carri TaxID=1656884 RepID=A0A967AYJ4_9MICO|nr:type II secretion system F family protein [Metallococcus carri]NHN55401.1 hypothetical protein [Metallococcus carri]NOP36478.1 hypothetical protein [Calidifontibacter sp. DB2511S]